MHLQTFFFIRLQMNVYVILYLWFLPQFSYLIINNGYKSTIFTILLGCLLYLNANARMVCMVQTMVSITTGVAHAHVRPQEFFGMETLSLFSGPFLLDHWYGTRHRTPLNHYTMITIGQLLLSNLSRNLDFGLGYIMPCRLFQFFLRLTKIEELEHNAF